MPLSLACYSNVRQAMQERSRALDLRLEIVDASHDLAQEIEALKRAIALAAARLINTGDTAILDAGITTAYLAQALHGRSGISIITNSVTGVSLKFGLSNTNMQETAVERAMIAAAREVTLLADHTKIGVESLVKVAPVDCLHRLISDSGVSPQQRLALTQQGIEVIIADETSAA
jgi:DeoR/GlpR family transcriptional regulator of sugar metabolism